MTFYVDYLQKTTDLLKEAFKFKKYKAMPAALAVFLGLIVLPFVLVSFALAAVLFIGSFIYKVISAPMEHLHDVVHKEGQSVKHATQFIVYFISWGFIFTLYVLASFLMLFLTFIYALFSLVVYLWTFGGVKFHLYADETDDISVTVNTKYPTVLPLMLLLSVIIILVLIPLIMMVATLLPLHISKITVDVVMAVLISSIISMVPFYLVFTAFYCAIGLCPYPKAKVEEIAEEAPVEEAPVEEAPVEESVEV